MNPPPATTVMMMALMYLDEDMSDMLDEALPTISQEEFVLAALIHLGRDEVRDEDDFLSRLVSDAAIDRAIEIGLLTRDDDGYTMNIELLEVLARSTGGLSFIPIRTFIFTNWPALERARRIVRGEASPLNINYVEHTEQPS